MNASEEFKLTFANSFWWFVLALVLAYFLRILIEMILFLGAALLNINLSTHDAVDISTLAALLLAIALGRELAYRAWKRSHEALS